MLDTNTLTFITLVFVRSRVAIGGKSLRDSVLEMKNGLVYKANRLKFRKGERLHKLNITTIIIII